MCDYRSFAYYNENFVHIFCVCIVMLLDRIQSCIAWRILKHNGLSLFFIRYHSNLIALFFSIRMNDLFWDRAMWAYVFAFIRFHCVSIWTNINVCIYIYVLHFSYSMSTYQIEVYCLFVTRKNNWPLASIVFLVTPFVCLITEKIECVSHFTSLNYVWVLVSNWMWNK